MLLHLKNSWQYQIILLIASVLSTVLKHVGGTCCWNLLTPEDLSILMLAAVLIPFVDSFYDKGSVLTLVGVKISIKVANQHGGGILWITVAVAAAPLCHMCHT